MKGWAGWKKLPMWWVNWYECCFVLPYSSPICRLVTCRLSIYYIIFSVKSRSALSIADLFSCSPTACWGRGGLLIAAFYTLQVQLAQRSCWAFDVGEQEGDCTCSDIRIYFIKIQNTLHENCGRAMIGSKITPLSVSLIKYLCDNNSI